MDVIRRFKLCW